MQVSADNKVVIYSENQGRSHLTLEEWAKVRTELFRRAVPEYAKLKVQHTNGQGWTVIATWDPENKPEEKS